MNLNLISLLIVGGLSLQVYAERNSDRGSRSWGGQSASATPRSEPSAPSRSAPSPMSIPSAPQSSRSFSAPERSYTPNQSYRSASVTRQVERAPVPAPTPAPQRETPQQFSETRRTEGTFPQPVTKTQPIVQPARPATPPPSTVHSAPERASRTASTRNHEWGREAPDVKTATPATARPSTPAAPDQRIATPTREPRTFRLEEPGTVQITPPRTVQITPARTKSRVTEKSSSPFIFSDRSRSSREPFEVGSRTPATKTAPLNQTQLQTASLRSPQRTDSRTYGDDRVRTAYTSNLHPSPRYPKPLEDRRTPYYSHHYPSHSRHHDYRPMTCYSGREAFWTAFGFTLGASLFAPVYVAPFGYSHVSYSTAWHGGSVTVSVGGPAYSYYRPYYRPYYCNTGYIHDGWYHSSAYYGGWRCNWYGGFSYMFNPMPVYRSYYLYEEPQTIMIEQPAPQVVYVNQPVQQVVEHVQQAPAIPASETPQLQTALPVTTEAQTAQAQEDANCFCACKCNGRVPCICEYACGSEFAYSPDDYTLKGFASYSESLNAELIWSSYAGLDRPEATDIVAGTAD